MILYLLFVMGEAIARESMTFIGCMPLFVACGCQEDPDESGGGSAGPPAASRRSRNNPVARRSDADDFARRIRNAERRKQ